MNMLNTLQIPSQKQLRMLIFMYPSKVIAFEDQAIFSRRQTFREEMQKLINWDRVEAVNGICADGRHHIERYKLAFNGGMEVERMIKYHERNSP